MTTLDQLLYQDAAAADSRDARRQVLGALAVGLYRAGWLLAKLVYVLLVAVGGLFYAVGWVAARAVWPALCWAGKAVRLGWHDARRRGD